MSLEKFVESQINQAMARGEFDNLAGKGQPLDLNGYFQTPEHLRVCYSILKSGDFVPQEVQMLKEIESLKAQAAACTDEKQAQKYAKLISDKMLSFRLAMEGHKRNK